jgi:hypothetical protein
MRGDHVWNTPLANLLHQDGHHFEKSLIETSKGGLVEISSF